MKIIRGAFSLFLPNILSLVIATGAAGQEITYEVGHPSVDGSSIRPYYNEWDMSFRTADGTERPMGRWTDSLDVIDKAGQEVLRRVQVTYDTLGALTNRQVQLVDPFTMEPILSHLAAGDRIKHVDFAPKRISGFILLGSDATAIVVSETPTEPAFDWDIAGTLLVAFHMQPGEQVSFPYYDLGRRESSNGGPPAMGFTVKWATATAHDFETVEAGRLGEVEALRVTTIQGSRTLSFWLIDEAPYIVKLISESPRGAGIWTMR